MLDPGEMMFHVNGFRLDDEGQAGFVTGTFRVGFKRPTEGSRSGVDPA